MAIVYLIKAVSANSKARPKSRHFGRARACPGQGMPGIAEMTRSTLDKELELKHLYNQVAFSKGAACQRITIQVEAEQLPIVS